MKRVLAITVVLGLVGCGAWGAGLSGTWDTAIDLLPTLAIEQTSLEISYVPVTGWTFTSTSTFTADGFTGQLLAAKGSLGIIAIEMSFDFSPSSVTLRDVRYTIPDAWTGLGSDLLIVDGQWMITGPHLKQGTLDVSLEFAGLSLGLGVVWEGNHMITLAAAGVVGEYLFYLDIPSYDILDHTLVLQPHPTLSPLLGSAVDNCHSKYFLAYANVGLVATEVTFEVRDIDSGELVVSHALSGTFEVYHYDADTGTVILTLGADTYLWQYFGNYAAKNSIDLDPTKVSVSYTIDPQDVYVTFLFPSYMTYVFSAEADPFTARIVFDDLGTGIQFEEATLTMSGISLCCGVTYDAELAFNKCEGFEYLKFSINDVFPICCGISFDIAVTFTTDAKTISLTPKLASIGEACFELYADLVSEGGENADLYLNAIRVDGWKIRCEIADCNYVEYVSFLSPDKAPDYGYSDFEEGEFEYMKLGFCGPGCCGGEYTVDIAVYFGSGGTLFDITRIGAEMSIPLMSNFMLNVKFASDNNLDIGWTFTF